MRTAWHTAVGWKSGKEGGKCGLDKAGGEEGEEREGRLRGWRFSFRPRLETSRAQCALHNETGSSQPCPLAPAGAEVVPKEQSRGQKAGLVEKASDRKGSRRRTGMETAIPLSDLSSTRQPPFPHAGEGGREKPSEMHAPSIS